jgi:hypothetical protein
MPLSIKPFWNISPKGLISLDEANVVNFLSDLGYATYYYTESLTEEPLYLRKEGSFVEPIIATRIHSETIKSITNGIIDDNILAPERRDQVTSKLISSSILKKPEVLSVLPVLDKPILSDTPKEAMFFFKNGVVIVTPDQITLTHPEVLDGYIWKSQLINRNFNECSFDDIDNSQYYRFLCNLSGVWESGKFKHSIDRYRSLLSLHGYLLHSYKNPTNPRAVILMDSSASGEPAGRTGKGLLLKGLGQLLKVSTQDGKTMDPRNRFKFSDVDTDVKIIFIDDVPAKFDFEQFFSLISEDMIIESKYSNKFHIPFSKSPKIAISTNYTVSGNGSSNEGRKYEFELSDWYSSTHTPKDDFGSLFFDEWDSTEWQYFDNLMMIGVKYYLKNGVYLPVSSNIKFKKLVTETSQYFAEWVESSPLEIDTKYIKNELYYGYSKFCDGSPGISNRGMNNFLKAYARFRGWKFQDKHSENERYIKFTL